MSPVTILVTLTANCKPKGLCFYNCAFMKQFFYTMFTIKAVISNKMSDFYVLYQIFSSFHFIC